MTKTKTTLKAFVAGMGLIAVPAAFADLDTLNTWGDAVGDGGANFTNVGGGVFTLTGGGADFWGGSDQGVLVHDSTGAASSTGDFTSTVQFNEVDADAAQDWGRSGLSARATQSAITPAANDAHLMAVVRSDGRALTGWRDAAAAGTGRASDGFATGPVSPGLSAPVRMAVARNGDSLLTSFSTDVDGDGTYSTWITNLSRNQAAWAAGNEVTVGVFHQAHNQGPNAPTAPAGAGGGGGRVNTATFQDFTYQGSFDATKFNSLSVAFDAATTAASGVVTGTASIVDFNGAQVAGAAVDYSASAFNLSTFVPAYGVGGRDPTAMDAADIVPPANFRYDNGGTNAAGLKADIYLAGNAGNIAANQAIIDGAAPNGTAIIPNIDWRGGGDNDANYNGLTGPASFGLAVDPAFDGTAGAFSGNQDNYGVDMTGQIWIEPNGGHVDAIEAAIGNGGQWVQFEDGVDDFVFLEIDGQTVVNDNNWTGVGATENGGANIGLFDATDGKFDDGEWVDFRMLMWEGGGGDNGVLYSDMYDDDNTFNPLYTPGAGTTIDNAGSGSVVDGSLGLGLAPGTWIVTVSGDHAGVVSGSQSNIVTVIPEPGAIALIALSGLAFIFRRRK